jgi:hypothetical protein
VAWGEEFIAQRRTRSRIRTRRGRLALAVGLVLTAIAMVASFGLVVREVPWGLLVVWIVMAPSTCGWSVARSGGSG